MNEVLIGSLIDKVDAQERKIAIQENQINALKEKTGHAPDYTEILNQIKTGVEGLRANFQRLSFPEKEVRELSAILETSIELLSTCLLNPSMASLYFLGQ